MSANAMRQLEERHMATKIDLMVWSNKMDLLALSNAKGEVSLHRLSWQKVWSLVPPAEDVIVKGMSWRPDGKIIAIGYSNNDVRLVSVENKEIVHTINYSHEISPGYDMTYLQWLDEKGTLSEDDTGVIPLDNCKKFLPKLTSISRTYGTIAEEVNESFEDSKKMSNQKDLNFLVVAFSNGHIHLSVFGIFACGVLELPESFTNARILSAEIETNLKELYFLIYFEGELKLITYSSMILSTHDQELYSIAYKYGQLMSLKEYLNGTIQAIVEAYENMLLVEMESKLSQYANSNPEGSVSADFLELLMFNVATDSLEQFLLQDMTDKGINKLSTSMELSHSNIQKLILKNLKPVLRGLAFHLNELQSMSRYSERYEVLGLDKNVVAKSFSETGSFILKSTEVLSVIDDSLKKYKALFKWLSEVILRITDDRMTNLSLPTVNEQDIIFIADYLYNLEGSDNKKVHCYLDRLGQYIADEDLAKPVPNTKNRWESFVMENPCLEEHPIIVKRYPNFSLIQQHKKFLNVIKSTFEYPKKKIGEQIKLKSVMSLMEVTNYKNVSMKHLVKEEKILLAVIPQEDTTFLVCSVINLVKKNINSNYIYFKSKDPELGYKTIDLEIYTNEIVSVLLEQPGEERHAIFAQLPTKSFIEPGPQNDKYIDGSQLVEVGGLRPIENMVACKLAVSGVRKVAVLLSENMHKVRTYEMEVEDDEEEEDMDLTRESDSSTHQIT